MADIGLIKNGAVFIVGDTIEAVGPSAELQERYKGADCLRIDATGKAVLPGFVDSHTHLVFGGYRADEFSWRLRGDSYLSIMERGGGINASVSMTRNATDEELIAAGMDRLSGMLEYGVTTVESKSGYGLDKDTELRQLRAMRELNDRQPVELVPTFMGAHSVLPEHKGKERAFLDWLLDDVMPTVKAEGLAEFVDIFTENNVFSIEDSRYYLNRAREMGFKLKMHADEMVQLGGAELAAEVGAVSADHLLNASDQGIADMARAGVIGTVLPATAFCLKEDFARARYMIDQGMAIAIATDLNPGSCFTHSVPLLIALSCLYMGLSVEEVITALTLNAAAAVGRADRVGQHRGGQTGRHHYAKVSVHSLLPYHPGSIWWNGLSKRASLCWINQNNPKKKNRRPIGRRFLLCP